MTEVPNQPAALNANLVSGGSLNVSEFRHRCQKSGEIHACMTGQCQRMPEASVNLHEDRYVTRAKTIFDHGHAMPIEGAQHGEAGFSNLWRRKDALAQRAA